MAKRIGELLKEKGFLNDAKLEIAMAQQRITGELLGETLKKLGFVSAKEIAQTLAEQAGVPYIDLEGYNVSEEALKRIPKETAERAEFFPMNIENTSIAIGVTNPSNIVAIDTVTKLTGMSAKVYMVDTDSFYEKIDKAYYFLENPVSEQIDTITKELNQSESAPSTLISSFSELLLKDGIRRNATDIHINPAENTVHVFYRVDGILQHGICFSKKAQSGVITKIKVLSSIDIAEQRLPQDGSFRYSFLKKNYDMRVSTVPTIYGENLVIRILSGTGSLLRITNLGFDEEDIRKLKHLFNKPFGIILITGPTGSGKTTTLYSILREINLIEKNVLTVEDPVEYRLSLVKQTQVNLKAGYDFALAGRNFMRQDPDVMLLGEIRDENTASIAIRASITGHLVLSTLHTNDAITSIPRLLDYHVDRFLLGSSLLGIVAQRLIRKICPHCKVKYDIPENERYYLRASAIEADMDIVYKGSGCHACNQTGYLGRTVIGEILIAEDELKELISEGASIKSMKDMAVKKGMKTIQYNAIQKVFQGITTIEEVQRVTG